MDPILPFACPQCGMPSVAVGICPDCHLELVARAMQEAPEVLESIGPGLLPILTGFSRDCEQAARLLARAKIPTSMGKQEATGVFQLLVPAGSRDRAEQVLTEDWEREVAKQGLAPKMEAIPPGNGARCPACGDPVLPNSPECPACGIALT